MKNAEICEKLGYSEPTIIILIEEDKILKEFEEKANKGEVVTVKEIKIKFDEKNR